MTENEKELWTALRKADAMMLAAKEHAIYSDTKEYNDVLEQNKSILYKYARQR